MFLMSNSTKICNVFNKYKSKIVQLNFKIKVVLKRQRLQTEAMSALDAKTNEMLIRNAQNTAEQAKMTARLASGSSIKVETLEQTWRTIVSGIDETKQIQETARKQRVEDQKRLEAIKAQFDQMYHMPDKGSVNH